MNGKCVLELLKEKGYIRIKKYPRKVLKRSSDETNFEFAPSYSIWAEVTDKILPKLFTILLRDGNYIGQLSSSFIEISKKDEIEKSLEQCKSEITYLSTSDGYYGLEEYEMKWINQNTNFTCDSRSMIINTEVRDQKIKMREERDKKALNLLDEFL